MGTKLYLYIFFLNCDMVIYMIMVELYRRGTGFKLNLDLSFEINIEKVML